MGIEVTFSDEAVSKIADAGFDDVYGARPLKRAIQSRIAVSYTHLDVYKRQLRLCRFTD